MVLDRASLDSQRIQERRCDSFLAHLVFHHGDRKIYEMQKASSRACYNARFWRQLSKMRHGKPTGSRSNVRLLRFRRQLVTSFSS